MKNVSKKILSVGLCATMALSMAACGSDNAGTSSESQSSSVTESSSASTGTETNNTSTEKRVIKIGTWYDHYYDSTNADIYDDPSVSDEELAQKHFDVVKEVEDKYNVEIQFVNLTYDGIQESINTSILAGHPDVDIYEVDLSFGIPAALNGFATNLQDVLPADNDLFHDQVVFSQVDIGKNDGVYLFQSNSGEMLLANTYMLAYNKQMLDEVGLEDPNALYERGEWTWDKWREYMLALTRDTDGDGVTDVYGYGSRWDFLVYNLLMTRLQIPGTLRTSTTTRTATWMAELLSGSTQHGSLPQTMMQDLSSTLYGVLGRSDLPVTRLQTSSRTFPPVTRGCFLQVLRIPNWYTMCSMTGRTGTMMM